MSTFLFYCCKCRKTIINIFQFTLLLLYILQLLCCNSKVDSAAAVIPGIVSKHRNKVRQKPQLRTPTGSYGFRGYSVLHIMFPQKRGTNSGKLKDTVRDKTKQKGPNRPINPDVTSFDGDIEFSERALRLCSTKWIIRGSSVEACPTHHQKNWSITQDHNHNLLIYQKLGSGSRKLYSFVTAEGSTGIQMSRFFKNIVSMTKHPYDERIFNLRYSQRLQHHTLLHKRSGKYLGLKRQGYRGNLVAALVDEENASKVTVR